MPWSKNQPPRRVYRTAKYRRDRAALIAAFRPGQPCCLCGHPIETLSYVEAQHIPGTDTLLGLCHGTRNRCGVCRRPCNQTDAAIRSNQRRPPRPPRRTSHLRW
jgi:hypothetical protein